MNLTVCKGRRLNVNVSKSKVMIFERAREQTVEFTKPCRVQAEGTTV